MVCLPPSSSTLGTHHCHQARRVKQVSWSKPGRQKKPFKGLSNITRQPTYRAGGQSGNCDIDPVTSLCQLQGDICDSHKEETLAVNHCFVSICFICTSSGIPNWGEGPGRIIPPQQRKGCVGLPSSRMIQENSLTEAPQGERKCTPAVKMAVHFP